MVANTVPLIVRNLKSIELAISSGITLINIGLNDIDPLEFSSIRVGDLTVDDRNGAHWFILSVGACVLSVTTTSRRIKSGGNS